MQGQYRGDFTRDTFHPAKHFSRVLIQQGRVQLDADWNEQTAILLHYLRSLAADLIGPHGGPAVEGTETTIGFFVKTEKALTAEGDFLIAEGHYYVDGILCELDSPAVPVSQTSKTEITLQNTGVKDVHFETGQYVEVFEDGAPFASDFCKITKITKVGNNTVLTLDAAPAFYKIAKVRHVCTYKTQPDYPVSNDSTIQKDSSGNFLVYLDVWERHITYLEDAICREVALGGADTATRAQVVWQVKTIGVIPDSFDDGDWRTFVSTYFQFDNRGLLKARVQPQTTSTDPCTISPASVYRGAENQLYRIEINTNGSAPNATFKWSRENGSVVFPILGTGSGASTITLGNLGRDQRLGLNEGDWVEILDDNSVLQNQPGMLLKVVTIDRSNLAVTLNAAAGETLSAGSAKHPLMRRWEQKNGDPNAGGVRLAGDGAVSIVEGTWIPLEDGIQIQFQKGGNYRTGDYWLIPARTDTGDIQWPRIRSTQSAVQPIPESLPPHGIKHSYAPLALIDGDKSTDLRRTFTTQAMGQSS